MTLATSGLPVVAALALLFAVLIWALHRPREDRMSQGWLERQRAGRTEVDR